MFNISTDSKNVQPQRNLVLVQRSQQNNEKVKGKVRKTGKFKNNQWSMWNLLVEKLMMVLIFPVNYYIWGAFTWQKVT